MAVSSGWFYFHFESEYFCPVWFAPADETGVPPEELREEYGGSGGRASHYRGHRTQHDDYLLHSEHWDYIEALRAAQSEAADSIRRAKDVALAPTDVRAMRGTVPDTKAPTEAVTDIMGTPLMVAALALLIDEAD